MTEINLLFFIACVILLSITGINIETCQSKVCIHMASTNFIVLKAAVLTKPKYKNHIEMGVKNVQKKVYL